MSTQGLSGFLNRSQVAELLGVDPDTITHYRQRYKPGNARGVEPFPVPDGHAGRSSVRFPLWREERTEELLAWAKALRDGRYKDVGRKSKGTEGQP